MSENVNLIKFISDENEEIFFNVLEQTTLNGVNYLLVTLDSDEEEAEALILKECPGKATEEAVYDIVENERELSAVADVFAELIEDIEFEKK